MGRVKNIFWGSSAKAVLWAIVWLLLIDVVVSFTLGSKTGSATALGRYFEYGRSVEGKIARAMVADPKDSQMLSAGWIEENQYKKLPDKPANGADTLVAVYGQSFSMRASDEAAARDGRITLRKIGGPAAPANHSYAAFKADAPLRKADVVVFGVLSTSVGDMGSFSGLIWHFENPAPFTFPRYRLQAGQLVEEPPVIKTEAEFRQAFSQQSDRWTQFRAQLRQSDRGYDRFIFDNTPADKSSIVRLLRRGWVAHADGYEHGVYDPVKGFNPQSEDMQALKAMLTDLSQRCKERGEHLVVLVLNSQGQSAHLNTALESTLKQQGIDYISTHTLFSANDPTNFLPDSHYVPAANNKLAAELLKRIRAVRPAAAASASAPR